MDLQAYLDETGTTQADFARQIGVSDPETVRRYLSGERMPKPAIMLEIADKTGGRVTGDDWLRLYAERTRAA